MQTIVDKATYFPSFDSQPLIFVLAFKNWTCLTRTSYDLSGVYVTTEIGVELILTAFHLSFFHCPNSELVGVTHSTLALSEIKPRKTWIVQFLKWIWMFFKDSAVCNMIDELHFQMAGNSSWAVHGRTTTPFEERFNCEIRGHLCSLHITMDGENWELEEWGVLLKRRGRLKQRKWWQNKAAKKLPYSLLQLHLLFRSSLPSLRNSSLTIYQQSQETMTWRPPAQHLYSWYTLHWVWN